MAQDFFKKEVAIVGCISCFTNKGFILFNQAPVKQPTASKFP